MFIKTSFNIKIKVISNYYNKSSKTTKFDNNNGEDCTHRASHNIYSHLYVWFLLYNVYSKHNKRIFL